MVHKNVQRVLDKFELKDNQELRSRLGVMPEQAKRVFMARWGIDGRQYCTSYKMLDEKLQMENSKQVYMLSKDFFDCSPYVLLFRQQKYDIKTFRIAYGYALLIVSLFKQDFHNENGFPKSLRIASFRRMKDIVDTKCLPQLSKLERLVITLVFGLRDGVFVDYKVLGQRIINEFFGSLEEEEFNNFSKTMELPKIIDLELQLTEESANLLIVHSLASLYKTKHFLEKK